MEANHDFSWYRIKNLRGTMNVEKDKVLNSLLKRSVNIVKHTSN